MATFAYRAIREPGSEIAGEIDAESQQAAVTSLQGRGLFIVELVDADVALNMRRRLQYGSLGGIRHADLADFTRDLASLLDAGMPLAKALGVLKARARRPAWRYVASGLRSRLEDGQTFSQALAKFPGVFDPVFASLVRAGEESGRLSEVLARLAGNIEQRESIYSRVRMAMIYPGVMLALGIVTLTVLLAYVVPTFSEVFKESGQVLPLPTRALIGASELIRNWWWAIAVSLLGLTLAIRWRLRDPQNMRLLHAALLRLPLAGHLVATAETAAFARTIATLQESGVTMLRSLHIAAGAQRNLLFQQAIENIAGIVEDGLPLGEALSRHPLFSESIAGIVTVGEESGNLPQALLRLADQHAVLLERRLKATMTLLEPAMIVLVGGAVGLVVAAMILPVFELGNIVQLQ